MGKSKGIADVVAFCNIWQVAAIAFVADMLDHAAAFVVASIFSR